jgi:hypothetical protein
MPQDDIQDWNFEYNPGFGHPAFFSLDPENVFQGSHSLKGFWASEHTHGDGQIIQSIDVSNLNAGSTYNVSLYAKANQNTGIGFIIFSNGSTILLNKYSNSQNWTKLSGRFRFDSGTTRLELRLYLTQPTLGDGYGWFDNVQLTFSD